MRKIKISRLVFNIFNYTFFSVFVIMCLFPLWYVFCYSISEPEAVSHTIVIYYPHGFSLKNIQRVLALKGFFNSVVISTARTVIGTVLSVICNTWMGYVFTKNKLPARKFIYRFFVITMYISGGMIPSFLVIKAYGLLNNFWVYILPSVLSAYNIILCKTYIESIPSSLEESAYLDGAGPVQSFIHVIFPLAKPISATIGIYAAVGHWNSWFDNKIYTFAKKSLTTMQFLLYRYLNEAQQLANLLESGHEDLINNEEALITPWGVKMTITMLTVLPIMVVYPFLQRHFVKGIMIGAVKG
jgi:multiple sugar transport system permease protein/putative aldouronate transport system permease protein